MITTGQLMLAVIATVALCIASSAIAQRIRYRAEGTSKVLPHIMRGIVALNLILLAWRVGDLGLHVAVASQFNCTVLLATLLTVIGLFSQRERGVLGLDGLLLPVAAILQLGAFTIILDEPKPPATAAWFVVHQLTIVASATLFITAGLSGGVYLTLVRTLRRKKPSPLLGRFAPLESWERVGRWSTLIGFGLFTFGILTGICEAVRLDPARRPYWLTDTVIVVCFGLWATYAAALVATWLVPSFRGRRAALLAMGSGVVLVGLFLAIDLLSVVH
jgi:ABC-type uncharacterized transport system permease subunit